MVKFYVNRIKSGKMTIEEVPHRWREEVQAILDAEKPAEESEVSEPEVEEDMTDV